MVEHHDVAGLDCRLRCRNHGWCLNVKVSVSHVRLTLQSHLRLCLCKLYRCRTTGSAGLRIEFVYQSLEIIDVTLLLGCSTNELARQGTEISCSILCIG